MDVTNKPFEFLEFEVWDNPEAFSLPHIMNAFLNPTFLKFV